MITQIEDVKQEIVKDTELPLPCGKIEMYKCIFDLSLPHKYRVNSFEKYCICFDDYTEILQRFCTMFSLSESHLIKEFLRKCISIESIDLHLRVECAKTISDFKALHLLINEFKNYPIPCRVSTLKFLLRDETYKEDVIQHICDIINMPNLEGEYRYKIILSFEDSIAMELCEYMCESNSPVKYKILAAQYILKKGPHLLEYVLRDFMMDEGLDYNLRADAADVILHLGSTYVSLAKEYIIILGEIQGVSKTIYDNAQNVHLLDDILEEEKGALEMLNSLRITATFDSVKKYVGEDPKVNIAITRIELDRAVYSKYHNTLKRILLMVWSYIQSSEHKDELLKRFMQEMTDGYDTCSTGIATRLLNVLSGYVDNGIKMTWRDQIAGNLYGRLNARIRQVDENDRGMILEEMIVKSNFRPHFMKFFRDNISSIQDEMYAEFRDYIDDTDFDLYFKYALISYGVN